VIKVVYPPAVIADDDTMLISQTESAIGSNNAAPATPRIGMLLELLAGGQKTTSQ
jgi:hypothetical protein